MKGLTALLLVAATPGLALAPGDLAALFPQQAAVIAPGSGLCRLELPPEVLARCRPDLSDLRLFTADGRELPYLVESFAPDEGGVEVVHSVTPPVVDVRRSEDRDSSRPTRFAETYVVDVPALTADAGSWELVLETPRREVMRRLRLTHLGNDGSRSEILDGSAFRLVTPPAERLRFPLAAKAGRLEIALEGEGDGFLEPRLVLAARRFIAAPGGRQIPLERLRVESRGNETVAVFARPRGLVPDRLSLTTATGAFSRQVTVWDEGPTAAAEPLGRADLFRLDAFAPVASLELVVAPARGERLRVVIADRDSPPLDELALTASVARPTLFFSLPEGATAAVLRFGGGRARRPDYDLAALRPAHGVGLEGNAAERALALWDPMRSQPAALAAIVANPAFDSQPALAFAMHPGAEHDGRPYARRRQLAVAPSIEGLARLVLAPEDLATARPDLADLRVVDGDGRQWAYLIQPDADRRDLTLVPTYQQDGRRSHYRFTPDPSPVTAVALTFDPLASFFDRAFELAVVADDGARETVASGRLVRHQGDPRPLSLALGDRRVTRLELSVDDGDDAPLALRAASLTVPSPALFVAAPAGPYTLLLGHPDATAPRYELERIRSTVLAVPAGVIEASGLEDNPAYAAGVRLASSAGAQRTALWLVLGIAVAALAALSLRLARQAG